MLEWIHTVWNQRASTLLRLPNMLVLDAFRRHLTELKQVLRDGKTDPVIIPGGVTSTSQPLDIMLNKPFKECVRKLYNEWMADDNLWIPPSQLQRTPLVRVCMWVSQVWRSLPNEMVVHTFKCCISNLLDGTKGDMLWDAATNSRPWTRVPTAQATRAMNKIKFHA